MSNSNVQELKNKITNLLENESRLRERINHLEERLLEADVNTNIITNSNANIHVEFDFRYGFFCKI